MWFRRKKRQANPMQELREKILTASAAELGFTDAGDDVWVAVMEMGYPDAVVTLIALADDTTSLYFSNGGGVIGAGAHESVQVANRSFREAARTMIAALAPAAGTPMPDLGEVVFYVRRGVQTLSGRGVEADLGEGRHPLAPLFHSGHQVITAIREATPR